MDMDEIEGKARGAVGKAQKAFGDVTGDTATQAEGMARQVAGQAQDAYGEAKDAARGAAQQLGRAVEQQPLVSLLVAGAVGFALAALTLGATDRRSSRRRW